MKRAVLVRESPPQRVRYDWDKIADTLRADPGEWYRIFDRDRVSLATAIRQDNGIKALYPRKGFEVRTTNNTRGSADEPRMCTLYLRYNPEKDTEKGRDK